MQKTENFKRGTVELVVLKILFDGDKYGYEITKDIKERSDGKYDIPLGTLYPVLYRLVESKYISDSDRIVGKRLRKYYHIEEDGKTYYYSLLEEYRNISAGVNMITGDDNE